jgi:hypothetical protein
MGDKRVIVVEGEATLLRRLLELEGHKVVVLEMRAPPPLPDLTFVKITPKRGVPQSERNKKCKNKIRAKKRDQNNTGRK